MLTRTTTTVQTGSLCVASQHLTQIFIIKKNVTTYLNKKNDTNRIYFIARFI
jgi:hypothetical protein